MNNQRGTFVSKGKSFSLTHLVLEHLMQQLKQLAKILPSWLQLKKNDQGTMLKCHKNLNISGHEIKNKITAHFEKKEEPEQRSRSASRDNF